MCGGNCDLAARFFEVGFDAVGQTLAIVVIGIGQRRGLDTFVLQNGGKNLSLSRIRRGGAEKQTVVIDAGKRWRSR